MLKSILHLDLDSFFVSVERLQDSRLNGKPVLIGGKSDRGVVASCSYEARKYGIHSAMPMKMARQLCPEAIILRGDAGLYTKHSRAVTEIIQTRVPAFEKSSIDEFYVDLTGMDRHYGCLQYATELRRDIIRETGLPISFGLSQNKTVSKVATGEAKPNNQLHINYGNEKQFLSPLAVKKIPGAGTQTCKTLYSMGVRKIYTLQDIPMELLERIFGKNGRSLWKKANGIDHSPIRPYSERKSISTERTFERDTIDISKLKTILVAMTENLAFQLRRGRKMSGCVAVKLRYSDFSTQTMQTKITYTATDHALIPTVLELFKKLYTRRVLIRLIGVRLSHLISGGYQINLFEDTEEQMELYSAMDKIREKYGDRSIVRASGFGAKSISRFNPFNGEPPPLLPNRRA